MKIIKRLFADLLGIFECYFAVFFHKLPLKRGVMDILVMFVLWIFVLPILLWLSLKFAWKMLHFFHDSDRHFGKIFIYFSVFATIAAVIMHFALPDLYYQLSVFSPISTSTLQTFIQNTCSNYLTWMMSDSKITQAMFAIRFCLTGTWFGLFWLFTYGASNIPIIAYIELFLFVGMIINFVQEVAEGTLFDLLLEFWQFDLSFYTYQMLGPWLYLLYLIPGVNIITYRILWHFDKKWPEYPPVNANGKFDANKLIKLNNKIYLYSDKLIFNK